jgi:tRNA1Val (adenine37-N6)-methyltransferase
MTMTIEQARDFFPRGLMQPENGFRFAVDALLLACYARPRKNECVLDLGTGCGVVGLGLLLRHGSLNIRIVGLDRDENMACSARANVRAMGFEDRMGIVRGDVCDASRMLLPERTDVVVCNPPYRETGRGRICLSESRNQARFLVAAALEEFVAAAGHALKNRGRMYVVFLAEGLDRLFAAMQQGRIRPKRVLPVHGRMDDPARLVLVEGRKNGGQGLVMESPLFLHGSGENRDRITREALAFCPFLACNVGR